jgi:hypothetical protein
MHEDFIIYLSFPGLGGAAAHLRWPTAHPIHSGPAVLSLVDALRPSQGSIFFHGWGDSIEASFSVL